MAKVILNIEDYAKFVQKKANERLAKRPVGRLTAAMQRQYNRGVLDGIKWLKEYLVTQSKTSQEVLQNREESLQIWLE